MPEHINKNQIVIEFVKCIDIPSQGILNKRKKIYFGNGQPGINKSPFPFL